MNNKSSLFFFLQIVVMLFNKVDLRMTCMMQGLTVKDMEELRDDIKMYLDSDRATPTRVQYWEVWNFDMF